MSEYGRQVLGSSLTPHHSPCPHKEPMGEIKLDSSFLTGLLQVGTNTGLAPTPPPRAQLAVPFSCTAAMALAQNVAHRAGKEAARSGPLECLPLLAGIVSRFKTAVFSPGRTYPGGVPPHGACRVICLVIPSRASRSIDRRLDSRSPAPERPCQTLPAASSRVAP